MAAGAFFWHHLFGSNRVVRGGSWNNNANNCRSGNRNQNTADNRNNNIGFRVCSAAPAQKTGRMSLTEPDDASVLLTEDVPGGRAGSDCGAVANVLPPPSTLMVRLKDRQGARTHWRERWTIFHRWMAGMRTMPGIDGQIRRRCWRCRRPIGANGWSIVGRMILQPKAASVRWAWGVQQENAVRTERTR